MVPPENNSVKRSINVSVIEFIDTHPRMGWYFAVLLVFNTIINVLELFS